MNRRILITRLGPTKEYKGQLLNRLIYITIKFKSTSSERECNYYTYRDLKSSYNSR